MMSAQLTGTSPITKSILVDCTPEHAFDVFTRRIAEWWPLHAHSIHQEHAETVVVEPRQGGEVYELSDTGERAHWATVTAWEPPHRVTLSWHVNPESPAPTEIEVTFAAQDGKTLVTLEHRNWELLGPELGTAGRSSYATGWDPVLARFAEAATA